MSGFYRFARALVRFLMRLTHPVHVTGSAYVPEGRPTIVISNHKSNWDALVLAAAFNCQLIFFTKKELADNWLLGGLMHGLGAISVDRGAGDLAAMRLAIKTLEAGKTLCIFPQGHRVPNDDSFEMQQGACMIAIRSGATVQPVRINGRYRFFHRVELNVGEPYVACEKGSRPDKDEIAAIEQRMHDSVCALEK